MQFSAILNRFIVKTYLNSTFTNDLKKNQKNRKMIIVADLVSLKRGCTGASESTLVKMPYCLKPQVAAQLYQRKDDYFINFVRHPGEICAFEQP